MLERLERSFYAFMRHAGSPDDGRAAVAANRLIFDQPAKHSNIYRERLAAGSPIYGQPELRSSSGARPGDRAAWRESQAHGVSARRLRGKKIDSLSRRSKINGGALGNKFHNSFATRLFTFTCQQDFTGLVQFGRQIIRSPQIRMNFLHQPLIRGFDLIGRRSRLQS